MTGKSELDKFIGKINEAIEHANMITTYHGIIVKITCDIDKFHIRASKQFRNLDKYLLYSDFTESETNLLTLYIYDMAKEFNCASTENPKGYHGSAT